MRAKEEIAIDGSEGEGGGQILRSSLALSMVTGRPFRIENIRANREKPGLMRQHLTAVKAAQDVSNAEVAGGEIGSGAITFTPNEIQGGEYRFSVGTAGSATLVAQSILPALMLAKDPSKVLLEGGTHNPSSPPFDFFEKSFLPALCNMGVKAEANLHRPGYYPAGGGSFSLEVSPPPNGLRRIEILERGSQKELSARAVVSNLPINIAERELKIVERRLGLTEDQMKSEKDKTSIGPGNVLTISAAFENVSEVFSGFGQLGVKAEAVGERTVKKARAYLESDAAVGPYLADQLLLPMALAGGGGFTTLRPSLHLLTNVAVIRRFLEIEITVDEVADRVWNVKIGKG